MDFLQKVHVWDFQLFLQIVNVAANILTDSVPDKSWLPVAWASCP
jgi:hypothetical protein